MGGEEIWLICAKAGAERRLCESYESPPCDPAEAAAFAFSGENILFAKGDAKSVRTAIAAFEEIYGISAIEYIKDTV